MRGLPLDRARDALVPIVEALSDRDTLEVIAFASEAERWRALPTQATEAAKGEAIAWIRGLEAGGGTEMAAGVLAALEEAPDHIVVVTDGLVGFEEEVLETIRSRTSESRMRVHVLGVGPATNRSLTAPLARVGRGGEVIFGLRESAAEAGRRLARFLVRPVAAEIVVEGSAVKEVATELIHDVLPGVPLRIPVRLDPQGGDLWVNASGVPLHHLAVPAIPLGVGNQAIVTTFGRECVEALEYEHGESSPSVRSDRIARIGMQFQIATRLTSWIAVSEEVATDPNRRTREETVPQLLPEGLSAAGLGLRVAEDRRRLAIDQDAFEPLKPRFSLQYSDRRDDLKDDLKIDFTFESLEPKAVAPRWRRSMGVWLALILAGLGAMSSVAYLLGLFDWWG